MPDRSPNWSAPSLARIRPALLALTALAAGCTIYLIQKHTWSSPAPPKSALHRSNARRRRPGPRQQQLLPRQDGYRPGERPRSAHNVAWGETPISLEFLDNEDNSTHVYGLYHCLDSENDLIGIPLSRRLQTTAELLTVNTNPALVAQLRSELERTFLNFYFWEHLQPSPISDAERDHIVSALERDGGFSADNVNAAIRWHQDGELSQNIESWEQSQSQQDLVRDFHEEGAGRMPHQTNVDTNENTTNLQTMDGREVTVVDTDSEPSWKPEGDTDDDNEAGRDGQSLLYLLYRIAEEQTRKEVYVHRGVTCNSCSTMPIRGIRYRCANCFDFDLCEQCEAMQIHTKTHLFYKIRIPAPFLGNPRQPQPVWYPGKPVMMNQTLLKDIMARLHRETGYSVPEVEARWEQFRCLAATDWPDDPNDYHLAIDRRTFDKCFVPNTSTRPPPPNLIYDRMFSYYDTNNDGFIGFEEFLKGLASLTKKNVAERWKRIFNGYDINDDGFIDRKDFLRMFRAYYALTKELTRELVAGMEDDISESGARDVVVGSQPISSAFSGTIPPGDGSRTVEGKVHNEHGDQIMNNAIPDNNSTVDESRNEPVPHSSIIGETLEAAEFGNANYTSSSAENEVFTTINEGLWPPKYITSTDAERHMRRSVTLEDVTDLQDQENIRAIARTRWEQEFKYRHLTRRHAIYDRAQRQDFYIDLENGTEIRNDLISPANDDPEASSSRKKVLCMIKASDSSGHFQSCVLQDIRTTCSRAVPEPEERLKNVLQWIEEEWLTDEIVQGLCAAGLTLTDSVDFVHLAYNSIRDFQDGVQSELPAVSPPRSSAPSRRSRSSSKVRFEDDLGTDDEHETRSATSMSSRSVLMNERWGGFEVPEAEKDVGREVLYQVTQEALNELLNPIFKLREDLALSIQRTKRKREQYRSDIAASIESIRPRQLKMCIDAYQKRWRKYQNDVHPNSGVFGRDEAHAFSVFIAQWEARAWGILTTERCPRCAESGKENLIMIGPGKFCQECRQPSNYEIDYQEERSKLTKVMCQRCTEGTVWPGECCGHCGWPTKEFEEEEAKLRIILSGGRMGSRADTAKQEDRSSPEDIQISNLDGHWDPVLDLHKTVSAFNDVDPPTLERDIIQKPLDELLTISGYATIDTSSKGAPPPSDLILAESSSQEDRPDPTLPQHRPDNDDTYVQQSQTAQFMPESTKLNQQHEEAHGGATTVDEEKPPEMDTLRFYAAMDILEAEDKERGGPGRLSLKEFEELMNGKKGAALGFLGSWIDVANF